MSSAPHLSPSSLIAFCTVTQTQLRLPRKQMKELVGGGFFVVVVFLSSFFVFDLEFPVQQLVSASAFLFGCLV